MAVYLLTFSGELLSGAEQFSHSLAVDVAGSGGGNEEALLDVAEAAIEDVLTTGGTGPLQAVIHSGTSWTNIKCAQVLGLGTGALKAGVNRTLSLACTASDLPPPPQLALAVSLVGGPKANGTPYRGRFYVPAPVAASTRWTDGKLATAQQTNYLEAWAQFVRDFDRPIDNMAAQVWSRTDALTSTVTAVRMGRAFDTIRSRRRDMPEDYATEAI